MIKKDCNTCYYNYEALNYAQEQLCHQCNLDKNFSYWKLAELAEEKDNENTTKPALGLMPRKLFEESITGIKKQRAFDLIAAIKRRYCNEDCDTLVAWLGELNDLLIELLIEGEHIK